MAHGVKSRTIKIEDVPNDGRYTYRVTVLHEGSCKKCGRIIVKEGVYSLSNEEFSRGKKFVLGFCGRAINCEFSWANTVMLCREAENPGMKIGQVIWIGNEV